MTEPSRTLSTPELPYVELLLTPTEMIALGVMVDRISPSGPAERSAQGQVRAAVRAAHRALDVDDQARASRKESTHHA